MIVFPEYCCFFTKNVKREFLRSQIHFVLIFTPNCKYLKLFDDNQSNFGTGYGYQYGETEGTIEIYMDDMWRIFATKEVRQNLQFPE